MIVAFDRYFYDGFSYVVGAVFEGWGDAQASYHVMSRMCCSENTFKSGNYVREVEGVMNCLKLLNIDRIDHIVIDGYVWTTDDNGVIKKGFGARLQDAIFNRYNTKKLIVGISKNKYTKHEIQDCVEIKRGLNKEPLWITCSEPCYAEHYSVLVQRMQGDFRMPDIIRELNSRTKNYFEFVSQNVREELEDSEPIKIDFGTFEEWVAETEKRGFKH